MLWLATGTGLYRLDPRTGRIKHYRHNPSDNSGLNSNDVNWTGEDRTGTFWVGTNRGLDAFDRKTGKVTFHIPAGDERRISLYEDRFGVFWILSATGSGLAVLDRKTNLLTRYSFYEREPERGAFTGVMGIVEDQEGNLWLGSPGAGLLRFDRDSRRFVRYGSKPGDLRSPAEDKVICLYQDREGNIWTGLHSKEPNHFNPRAPLFENFRHEPGNPNSLDMDFVNAIYLDREGILWIGNDNALVRVDRKTGVYTSFASGLGTRPRIVTIIEDPSGILWVGTAGQGLSRFDRQTGRFKSYRHNPGDPSSLSNDQLHRLFIDHAGTLWVPTDDGLNRFEPATEKFKVYKVDAQDRLGQSFISITEDERGALWLGTRNTGLNRFDPATGRFTVYKATPGYDRGLNDNMVSAVQPDGSNALWVSTFTGLRRFDLTTGAFTSYDERNGLSGNAISCLLKDSRGDLWMSTNKGLSTFHPPSGTFKNYSEADGLPGNDLTGWNACFKSSSGEMFFGGFSGGVAFRPESLQDSSYAPTVALTDLRLSGSPVGIGGGSPLRNSISFTDRLTLSHEQSAFSLTFSALSYSSPGNNRYRYKLDGFDKTWHEVGSDDRLAAYTTLPAGAYTFWAQGATSRGPWSEPGVALQIEILPPFWATWWFRSALATLLLASLWYAHYLRLAQAARQFDTRFEERISERTRIARELHDTLLQSFHGLMFRFQAARNMLPLRPEEAIQALDGALERTEQAIAEGRGAIQDLRSEPSAHSDLEHLLTAMGLELRGSQDANLDAASFSVKVEGERQALSPILQDEVYRIARELLRNAFQHARARQIEAEIRYDDRLLRLRIRDDGKGMDTKVLQEGGRAGHWGLSGIRERAKQIGARLDFWSEAGAGTEVELTVPASVAYAKSRDAGGFRLFRKKTGTHAH